MELGLSLGDAPSKPSDGFTTGAGAGTTTTTTPVNKSLGFCMALGMNPSINQHPQIKDDGDEHDDDDDDDDGGGEEHEKDDDQRNLKENGVMKEMIVSSQRICPLNPPVQLDLLPSAPVPRHTPFPWSSDNGSSEGGSSGNAAVGRGFDVKRMPAAVVGTEEATSSFRLDFMSYRRIGNVNGGSNNNNNNNKRGFEIGNDAVEVERAPSRASDEDENGISRKKLRLSKEQSAYLEESFKEHNTLNPKQKLALAEQLNLRPRQVEVWFQNRRARTKLKQTEVDYEYLKRCCETLTDENRRLHKELQELRALKSNSNPFYRQLPATTLTMCPSCERVATTTTTAPPPSATATATATLEQNSKKATSSTTTPLTLSAKPRSLIFHAPPCNNSHHQPAAPS